MTGPQPTRCVAVVTGGGTAGHVLPALAIADAMVAAGIAPDAVHYVGTQRGQEQQLVPPTGYPATYLDVVGLQRSLSRRNLAVARVAGATRAARRLLRTLRPRVVVNVGGYGSFPATMAAMIARIPIVVVSYDLRPGLVSRLFARRAALVAVAGPGSRLPKAVVTGAPVRQEVLAVDRQRDRAAARERLGLPVERFVVVVACGSLGSRLVNQAVAGMVARLGDRPDLAVVHIVGERFVAEAGEQRDGSAGIMYRVLGFTDEMPAMYAAADLMITRGGAGTVAELATTGTPAVIMPWAGAAENHQLHNAKVLTDVGGGVLVEEAELSADRLVAEVERLQAHPEVLADIASRAAAAGAVHRSGTLVRSILAVAGMPGEPAR